ncbi:helix-turn-helix transcriptional regulator [Ovoidimarina sediminis]|uniref:helix-turn-helix transcriptional regulator n=1 Tax=Ovoidimarina sediminis TaxID=3079856 RepID=UPI00290AF8A3|nr:helix-turn-helix transcriptional regulator [Rhodophyticola sp. MJ-SS7]MDU8946034.1 helix-turn-helix transcriptional regulator [Rhodophyticola sp. MJ-SS7]
MGQVYGNSPFGSLNPGDLGIIGAIATWCECLQGKDTLNEALQLLAEGVNAEAIALSRSSRDTYGESVSIVYDKLPQKTSAPRLDRSFARTMLGNYFVSAKPGSVWFKSMVADHDPALTDFHSKRRLTELAVVPIATSDKSLDFLEFHFANPLGPDGYAILNTVVSTLTRTWANRKPGLFTDAMLRRKAPDNTGTSAPILGCDNPAKLSRAEFRVCLLLSRGLSKQHIIDELRISRSTLRSHLRSVYLKTGTNSHSELLYKLLSPIPEIEKLRDAVA